MKANQEKRHSGRNALLVLMHQHRKSTYHKHDERRSGEPVDWEAEYSASEDEGDEG